MGVTPALLWKAAHVGRLAQPPGRLPAADRHGRHRGPWRHRRRQAARDDRDGHPRPRLREHRACASPSPTSTATRGILRYRGYPIEELAEKATFLEVAWLLIYGELPTEDELTGFKAKIRKHTMLHEDFREFFGGFPTDAHPMAVLSSAVSALSTFYQDSLDPFDDEHVEMSTVRLMAKMPTIAAYAHKKSVGQPFLYPTTRWATSTTSCG
jgi:citrate synthase